MSHIYGMKGKKMNGGLPKRENLLNETRDKKCCGKPSSQKF